MKKKIEMALEELVAMGWQRDGDNSVGYRDGIPEDDNPSSDAIHFAEKSLKNIRLKFPELSFRPGTIDEWVEIEVSAK